MFSSGGGGAKEEFVNEFFGGAGGGYACGFLISECYYNDKTIDFFPHLQRMLLSGPEIHRH